MKVLFVRSGNNGIDPISQNQGESLFREGVEMFYFEVLGKGLSGYLHSIFRLRRQIRSIEPDIIHAHYALSGYLSFIANLRNNVVVSLMGSDVNDANKIGKILLKISYRFFWKAVIVKSQKMASKIRMRNINIIPNGVNFNNYVEMNIEEARTKLSWDKNLKHILFASDPDRPEKNYALAKKAISLLPRNDYEVHFLKGISQEEMVYYYNGADVLLLTSHAEGSPNVIKEAMACNCPIVTTNVGDVFEVIGSTKGCYVTSNDENEISKFLAKSLDTISRTKGRLNIMHLDSKVIAERIIELYQACLQRK